jgi:hypothetical protein
MIKEICGCGAKFEVDARSISYERVAANEWRDRHVHTTLANLTTEDVYEQALRAVREQLAKDNPRA